MVNLRSELASFGKHFNAQMAEASDNVSQFQVKLSTAVAMVKNMRTSVNMFEEKLKTLESEQELFSKYQTRLSQEHDKLIKDVATNSELLNECQEFCASQNCNDLTNKNKMAELISKVQAMEENLSNLQPNLKLTESVSGLEEWAAQLQVANDESYNAICKRIDKMLDHQVQNCNFSVPKLCTITRAFI
jgi:chromosome segregation ATPase